MILFYLCKCFEEGSVLSIVETVGQSLEVGHVINDLQDFGRVDDLLTQVRSLAIPAEPEQVGEYGETDKFVEADKFCRCECWKSIQEELAAILEVSDGQKMKALVHFEPITPVPITALFDQTVGRAIEDIEWNSLPFIAFPYHSRSCLLYALRCYFCVAEEEADTDLGHC